MGVPSLDDIASHCALAARRARSRIGERLCKVPERQGGAYATRGRRHALFCRDERPHQSNDTARRQARQKCCVLRPVGGGAIALGEFRSEARTVRAQSDSPGATPARAHDTAASQGQTPHRASAHAATPIGLHPRAGSLRLSHSLGKAEPSFALVIPCRAKHTTGRHPHSATDAPARATPSRTGAFHERPPGT